MRRSILLAGAGGITVMLALASYGADSPGAERSAAESPAQTSAAVDEPAARPAGKRPGFGGPARPKEMPTRGGNTPKRAGENPGPEEPVLRPEEVDAFLAFCRQHFPPLYDKLSRARETDPRSFRQMLRRVAPAMTRLMRLWREDPDEADRIIRIQKIEMALREQKQRYRSADSDQKRTEIGEEARRLLEQRFDLRQAKLKRDVDALRRRLDEQTRRLTEQERRKPEIVEDELSRSFEQPRGSDKPSRPHKPANPTSRPAVDQVTQIRP